MSLESLTAVEVREPYEDVTGRLIGSLQSDGQRLFFFFQAEDGIRDYKVTGVQTCALPISCIGRPRAHSHPGFPDRAPCRAGNSRCLQSEYARSASRPPNVRPKFEAPSARCEIGRASCRERV